MSTKPSNQPADEPDSDRSPEIGLNDSKDSLPETEAVEPEAAIDDEEEFDEEEFSLEQLSQAYANVLKGPPPRDDLSEHELTPTEGAAESETTEDTDRDEEAEDNAGCPVSPESIVESILFVGAPKDVKLTTRKLAAVLRDVSPKEVTKIVKKLNQQYESEQAVYRIVNDNGNLQLQLHPSLGEFQREFFGRNKPVRLGQPVIDVMAVVAYNQPVTREQVDQIRGKPSGSLLSQLVRRDLICVSPAENFEDSKRRYSTTEKFLDLFDLEEIGDLPQSHEVSEFEELTD